LQAIQNLKMSYCKFCETKDPQEVNRLYHDTQYGFPIESDDELFGRLILEINQAGLSWQTILIKQDNFRLAFDNFSIEKIAKYEQEKIEELLQNPGIIRNKLKINAAIHNAKEVLSLQKEHGSFKNWIELNDPKTKEEWVKLFKKNFKFVGGEIINEFLMSAGYLKGAHEKTCSIFDEVAKANPNWMKHENI
jgi:DNA-3-methyladenine glycosylase I